MTPSYKAIIFDMGEVLFSWSPHDHMTIPLETLRSMIQCDLWYAFERGEVSAEQCYQQLGEMFSTSAAEVAAAFRLSTGSLKPNDQMTALLRDIKRQTSISVHMMTNIPRPDFDQLRATEYIWHCFNGVFASAYEGMRKPESRFYRFLLDSIGVRPAEAIFVDDRLENVIAAQDLGMQGVRCTDIEITCQTLRDMIALHT